jgi:hypothetical protein
VALYPPRCASDSSSYHVFKGRYLLNKYVVLVVLKERRIGFNLGHRQSYLKDFNWLSFTLI